MFLRINENNVLINGKPYVSDLKFRIDHDKKLCRMKFAYLMQDEPNEDIDLALSYTSFKISMGKVSIDIIGTELNRQISFQAEIEFKFLARCFYLKGSCNNKKISKQIHGVSDILDVLKSEIVSANKK